MEPVAAAREAKERIWARRQEQGFRELADAIQRRHGSRRSGLAASGGRYRRRTAPGTSTDQQLPLDLDLA